MLFGNKRLYDVSDAEFFRLADRMAAQAKADVGRLSNADDAVNKYFFERLNNQLESARAILSVDEVRNQIKEQEAKLNTVFEETKRQYLQLSGLVSNVFSDSEQTLKQFGVFEFETASSSRKGFSDFLYKIRHTLSRHGAALTAAGYGKERVNTFYEQINAFRDEISAFESLDKQKRVINKERVLANNEVYKTLSVLTKAAQRAFSGGSDIPEAYLIPRKIVTPFNDHRLLAGAKYFISLNSIQEKEFTVENNGGVPLHYSFNKCVSDPLRGEAASILPPARAELISPKPAGFSEVLIFVNCNTADGLLRMSAKEMETA